MNEYKYLLNADNFYMCFMTDLKTTTFKKLKDEHKRTLLNRYLSLLVDDALSNNKPDFKIEIRMDINDDIVDISIGTAYPFIGQFDLSQPFNKSCVLNYLNNTNLVLSGNGREGTLNEFRKTQVLFTTASFNKKLSEYLSFIADDVLPFVEDNKIYYSIKAHETSLDLLLAHAYPFFETSVINLKIDLEQDFNSLFIIEQLNVYVQEQLKDPKTNFFVLIKDGLQFLETIKILENVLGFGNKLTSLYYNNSILKPINEISFLSIEHQRHHLSLEMVSKGELALDIHISQSNLAFLFGKRDGTSENFTWLRTDCMDHDTLMVNQFFIIYLEKWLGHKITDLAREIKLLEMEAI